MGPRRREAGPVPPWGSLFQLADRYRSRPQVPTQRRPCSPHGAPALSWGPHRGRRAAGKAFVTFAPKPDLGGPEEQLLGRQEGPPEPAAQAAHAGLRLDRPWFARRPSALRPAPACCVASGECLALSGLRWLARSKRCRRVSQGPLGGSGGRKHRVGADTAPRARPMAAARPALLRPPRGVPESHSRPRAAERGSPACPPLPLPAFSQGPWPPRPTPGARGACLLPCGAGSASAL